jgi:tetratricopeptide (TPR) repeat protein
VAQEAVLRGDWKRCSNEQKKEDHLAAIAACERLLENHWVVDADVATILFNKGRALRQLGKFDEAIATYTAAIERRETAEAYNLRGAIYYDKRDWEGAISDFGKAIALEAHNGEYRNNRAWTLYKSGRIGEALDDANAAIAALQGVAYPWDTRGHIHEALGNRAAALEDYRKAITIDPTLTSSREGLRRLGSHP